MAEIGAGDWLSRHLSLSWNDKTSHVRVSQEQFPVAVIHEGAQGGEGDHCEVGWLRKASWRRWCMRHPEKGERKEQERRKDKSRIALRKGRDSFGGKEKSQANWSVSVT